MASKASSRLFSPVWFQMVKQNKHRHIERVSPDGGMVALCRLADEKRVLPSVWRCSAALASVFAPQIAAFFGPPPASSAAAQDVFYSGRKVETLHRGIGHPFLNKQSSIWGKKAAKLLNTNAEEEIKLKNKDCKHSHFATFNNSQLFQRILALHNLTKTNLTGALQPFVSACQLCTGAQQVSYP